MAVYDRVDPSHLREALHSLVKQTLRPHEVVVIADGPLTEELTSVLRGFDSLLPMRVLQVPRRSGAGPARQLGVMAAQGEFLAIADADDISVPRRLEQQHKRAIVDRLTVLGAAMEEFGSAARPAQLRRAPSSHHAILHRLASNNPFNHPTLFLRADAARAAGGYRDVPMLEDYDFIVRLMSLPGVQAANDTETLVRFRLDDATVRRRAGPGALRQEVRLQRALLSRGFISFPRGCLNLILRSGYRTLPYSLRLWVHRRVLSKPDWRPQRVK